ncbi:MAG: SpoIIE family protein phosphatase [Anaerolineales bacterium]|jgi:serine phosphatase RsbU (regulator of sigma subunit)
MPETGPLSRTLRGVPLFATLPPGELQGLVSSSKTRRVPPGEVIIREGFHKDGFFVLLRGEAEVVKAMDTPDERSLGISRQGDLIGEMALFKPDGSHSASVVARTGVTLLELTKADLDDLLLRHPAMAQSVIRMLTERLSHSEDQTVEDLREKNRQLSQAYEELKAAQAQIIEKGKLERELEVARGIQTSLLPTGVPQVPGYNFAGYIAPASAVGGDFYDFIPRADGRLGIAVGDVSDHGVPSALMMAQSVALLRSEARRGVSPEETLTAINHEMLARDHMGMFLTALYGILDPKTGRFAYARAGHNLPLLMDAEGLVSELPHGPGQPLGLVESPAIDLGSVEIAPGRLLLLYTDGVTESVDESGDLFGIERTQQVLADFGPSASAEDVCQGLHAVLRKFRGAAPQADDVTSLAIKAVLA